MQIFSESLRNLWNKWELRTMVLLSLCLQSVLILLGNKRKYCSNIWLTIIVWLCYLSADGLAIMSLSVLSYKAGKSGENFVDPESVIMAFWAPFLLLHLGGPDTITAYSMEDNELWPRHLVRNGLQVGVAIYILLKVWTNSDLNFSAIPVFIAGIIKVWERIWVLWSASSLGFKKSLFPEPDPGPNYARSMEEHDAVSFQGFHVVVRDLLESPPVDDHTNLTAEGNLSPEAENEETDRLETAKYFFETFKLLFVDLILSFQDVLESRLSLQNRSFHYAFEVMEIELGFMYDTFFTKALVIYSVMGGFLRFISFSCNIIVLLLFVFVKKDQYPDGDVVITYVLLIGAVILEIYSTISLPFSDWAMLWLIERKNGLADWTIQVIQSLQLWRDRRWSNSVFQFNLIRFCLKVGKQRRVVMPKNALAKSVLRFGEAIKKRAVKCSIIRMIINVYWSCNKYMHNDIMIIPDDLKELIFRQLLKKINDARHELNDEQKANELVVAGKVKEVCGRRGQKVIESTELESELKSELEQSVKGEFDESIILWHIATGLCYDSGSDDDMLSNGSPNYRKASKLLSEYMMYLLVIRPFMLPNGIGEIRFQDTCAEAIEFIEERKSIEDVTQVCKKLLEVNSDRVQPSKIKGDRSKSVLFNACRLAKGLQKMENTEEMWELMAQVWVEMLAYAASHCQGIHHAQQLRRGGELLTHVWLLMAHLGITEQFQISEGHGRAKLIRN